MRPKRTDLPEVWTHAEAGRSARLFAFLASTKAGNGSLLSPVWRARSDHSVGTSLAVRGSVPSGEPGECGGGKHQISSELGDRDDEQEAPKRLLQRTSDHCEWIADERNRACKQGPISPALAEALGFFEMVLRGGKPASVAEPFDHAAERPVHGRSEDIADACDNDERCWALPSGGMPRLAFRHASTKCSTASRSSLSRTGVSPVDEFIT
jgi:diadenosine tetraphosphatase ApaH/serine/threonine PP2A family protein phosphatase